ncbi:sugar ABC transporter permease [Deinococcus maricopensis]|uniref:ABC-type transporter, integral membrane subunit n=1 Tax=Deinococcus maricopensis (strain DSM 21211 / LMG 22137 / NRRL B-23946 / LB-34) TaxID=709986 RepID=E8U7L4_DEIML|nr:sugar ABC transporter permease [Deinococcus maricopensis]ADV67053.1 ABC-type transporter, integral membrane subunit [Deinococcus maricopensis DSM 21211]
MSAVPSRTPSDPDVYVHREPNLLQRAVPWLIGAALLIGAFFLIRALGHSLDRRAPGVGVLFIKSGWVRALGIVALIAGVMALTSLIGQRVGQARTGRRISYLAVLGDQLTHLFLWLVIIAALYPLVFVVFTSLDPRNTITIFPTDTGNLLQRAGLMPDLSKLNWSNYATLFEGFTIPVWQVIAAVIIGAALAALLILALLGRAAPDSARLASSRAWVIRALVAALAVLVVFMSPAQFTGGSNESKFLLSVRNTIIIAGVTGLIALLLSTTAGYAMARLRFPGRFQTLLFFIFIQMFPVFLGLVAIKFMLFTLGLDNTFTGLILAYSGGAIAFNTWIYKGYVESLPESLEEAAMVDGATRWQAFWRVVLPLSGSMLIFIFLNQFIGTYAEYIIASQVLTGVENWTVGIMLQSFSQGQFSTKWGIFAAAAVLGALPIVALFYGFQRYFVGGAVAGGVKE